MVILAIFTDNNRYITCRSYWDVDTICSLLLDSWITYRGWTYCTWSWCSDARFSWNVSEAVSSLLSSSLSIFELCCIITFRPYWLDGLPLFSKLGSSNWNKLTLSQLSCQPTFKTQDGSALVDCSKTNKLRTTFNRWPKIERRAANGYLYISLSFQRCNLSCSLASRLVTAFHRAASLLLSSCWP